MISKELYVKYICILIAIIISSGIIGGNAKFNDSASIIAEDLQPNYLKSNYHNSLIIASVIDSDSNNKSLLIQFDNKNISDYGMICWNASDIIIEKNKTLTKYILSNVYEIAFAAKGARGDEWIDLVIRTGNTTKRVPLQLSAQWKMIKYYIYSDRPIATVCLSFSPYKNPVGARMFLSDIQISHSSKIDAPPSTRNTYTLMIENPKNTFNLTL
jgi:hypothetical protein